MNIPWSAKSQVEWFDLEGFAKHSIDAELDAKTEPKNNKQTQFMLDCVPQHAAYRLQHVIALAVVRHALAKQIHWKDYDQAVKTFPFSSIW
jgi:hypothetical protein